MSELSSRHVRALILLLIVGPLIPTALMLQLMLGSVRAERAAEEDRTKAIFGQALRTAASSLVARLKAEGGEGSEAVAARVVKATYFFNQCFAEGAKVRLVPPGTAPPVGAWSGSGPLLAETSLESPLAGWRVQLFQGASPAESAEALHYQIEVFTVIAVSAVLLNMTIAGLAGYALNRQMRVQELKSSSLETVSHELKTPLASTRVLLDTLLARSGDLAESTVEYVRLISDENSRLIHLTESFLTIARLERGGSRMERRPVAPAELFDAAVQTARARAGASQPELRVEVSNSLPDVLVDRDAVIIALANLIDNAIKYSSGQKQITLRARRENRSIEFQVIDQGIGIPRAEQKKIFDRFYQVNQTLARTHEGCGLGLSIVKSIVQAHGGRMEVTSQEGQGTMIGFLLPCS